MFPTSLLAWGSLISVSNVPEVLIVSSGLGPIHRYHLEEIFDDSFYNGQHNGTNYEEYF